MPEGPVPPVEWELRRIEAAAELVRAAVAERCIHCSGEPVVIAVDRDGLPRATELRHESGCPLAD